MARLADLPATMQAKITVHPISDCWNWTGAKNAKGYGSVTNGAGRSMLAHRRSYEALVGPIPDGLTIDHLCRNKACQNPDHMEPVTRAENSRRQVRTGGIAHVLGKPSEVNFAAVFDKHFGHVARS